MPLFFGVANYASACATRVLGVVFRGFFIFFMRKSTSSVCGDV